MSYAAVIIALFVSGCSQTSDVQTADAPRVSGLAGESATRAAGLADVIFVVPPSGASAQAGLVLADAIAAGLRDRNHPSVLSFSPNQAGASVIAEVVSAEPHGDVIWLSMDWHIRAPYGTYVATYRQHVVIDAAMWNDGSPEAINLLIGDAAPRILSMVEAEIGPPMIGAMQEKQPNKDMVASATKGDAPRQTVLPPELPEAQSIAPPQVSPPSTPIARISDRTNGQVVAPDGSQLTTLQPTPVAPDTFAETAAVTPPVELSSTDAAVSSQAPLSASGRPPLPSLLDMPSPDAAPEATSGPSTALVPGAGETVPPPPGGIATDAPEGFLDRLRPNMTAETRREGDARPDVAAAGSFAQVRWGQPSFLIRPVAGASGNGNEALTAALKTALRDRDLTISEDPRQAGFIIDGDVDMGAPASGRQYVRIEWRVSTVTGEEVGKAVQENTVIAGSLDGEWGQVAEAVSNAAVRGIKDLFKDADDELSTRSALPDFPEVSLPSIPGRAPPPPAAF